MEAVSTSWQDNISSVMQSLWRAGYHTTFLLSCFFPAEQSHLELPWRLWMDPPVPVRSFDLPVSRKEYSIQVVFCSDFSVGHLIINPFFTCDRVGICCRSQFFFTPEGGLEARYRTYKWFAQEVNFLLNTRDVSPCVILFLSCMTYSLSSYPFPILYGTLLERTGGSDYRVSEQSSQKDRFFSVELILAKFCWISVKLFFD